MMPRSRNPTGSFGKIHWVQRANGTWSARAYLRDTDGTRRLISRTSTTPTAAEHRLRTALAEREARSTDPGEPTPTIREVAERWFAQLERAVAAGQRSPNTARLYRLYLDNHILPTLGALPIEDATVARVDEFITAVQAQHGTAAARTGRSTLSGLLGLAARRGEIAANPVHAIGRIPAVDQRVKARSLTVEECARWLRQLEADETAVRRDLPDLVRWLLGTGVRIGEAIAVTWDNIDLAERAVEIDHKILRVTGQGLLRVAHAKSAASHRTLPLPHFTMQMLTRRRDLRGSSGPLFPDIAGGWRDPSNVSRALREARGTGEFSWITSHVFRKTCATLLDESELSARQIADQLGHADVSMTQDNYLGRRLTNRRTAQALDQTIGEALERL
jgi:integrase